MNALPGWVAKVFHGTYPIAIADQQAQHGGIAVHRFHCEGGKTVFSAPSLLAIQLYKEPFSAPYPSLGLLQKKH